MTHSKFESLVKNTIYGYITQRSKDDSDNFTPISFNSILIFHKTNASPDKNALAFINDPHYIGKIYRVRYDGILDMVFLEVLDVIHRACYVVCDTDIVIESETVD